MNITQLIIISILIITLLILYSYIYIENCIEKQLSFYTSEWFRNEISILSQIAIIFKNQKLIFGDVTRYFR